MSYKETAEKLGLDMTRINSGETVHDIVTINSIEQFKDLFARESTNEQRAAFSRHLKQSLDQTKHDKDTHIEALMQRIMDYIYGTGTLGDEDRNFLKNIDPVRVEVMVGQTVEITGRPQSLSDELALLLLEAETVTFKGGYLDILGKQFTMNTTNLMVSEQNGNPYTIGVFGHDGTPGNNGSDGKAYDVPAAAGSQPSAPTPGICTGADEGGSGAEGEKGTDGGEGTSGLDGDAYLQTNIRVDTLLEGSEFFKVNVRSGNGGVGGKGGKGGKGQTGGKGGKGCDSDCECTDGGPGGKGGKGGKGGRGGNGGNGGPVPYSVNITFPKGPASTGYLITSDDYGHGAKAGDGGDPGDGGTGGGGGDDGKHCNGGAAGSGGGIGEPGDPGTDGNDGPRARIQVYKI